MTPTELKAIAEKLHYAIRPNESQCYALLNYITALEARVQAAEDRLKLSAATTPKGKQEMKTFTGQERIDHIAKLRKQARIKLQPMAVTFAMQLSYLETWDLLIGAVEDLARRDSATIRNGAKNVTASLQNVTRIGD